MRPWLAYALVMLLTSRHICNLHGAESGKFVLVACDVSVSLENADE